MKPAPLLRAALLLAAVMALGGGCARPEGLHVGEAELGYEELRRAEDELARSFPNEGRSTLRWHLLDYGMGAAALLHHVAADDSRAARAAAERWAGRLRSGEDFHAVRAAWGEETGMPPPSDLPQLPSPAALGARVAAAVAALEPGEWAGPLRTERGWEIAFLVDRAPGPRNRANVVVQRLVFMVGTEGQRAWAHEAWDTLPLAGNPEVLDALPLEFRRGRVAASP